MKLTKEMLKQIIREEIEEIQELIKTKTKKIKRPAPRNPWNLDPTQFLDDDPSKGLPGETTSPDDDPDSDNPLPGKTASSDGDPSAKKKKTIRKGRDKAKGSRGFDQGEQDRDRMMRDLEERVFRNLMKRINGGGE